MKKASRIITRLTKMHALLSLFFFVFFSTWLLSEEPDVYCPKTEAPSFLSAFDEELVAPTPTEDSKTVGGCNLQDESFCEPYTQIEREEEASSHPLQDFFLYGIILSEGSFPEEEPEKGIFFYDVDLPGNPGKLKSALTTLIAQIPLSPELIQSIESIIREFYINNGRPLVIVHIPEQKISNGILKVTIIESRIGQINYKGNRYFSSDQLAKGTHLKEGSYLDTNTLEDDLIWLNRNPFRSTLVILNPGVEEGTTDIDLITKDERPYRIFTGFDNTGFEATGQNRFFVGVKLANLFSLDQRLSYQYTASTDWGKFFSNTGQYLIPLPWRHLIDFYGGYSTIRAKMPFTGMTSKGKAWQGSGRYIVPLKSSSSYTHEILTGIDYKQTNVNLVLDAVPIVGNKAVITQMMLGYNLSFEHPNAMGSLTLNWFFSPGDIFPFQSDKDYQTLRPGADSTYTYARLAFIPIFRLNSGFDIVSKAEFQLSSANLLSSEQFGLGGIYTIRGYDERILNTDNAGLLSLELRTPRARILTRNKNRDKPELFQFLIFLDYGFGANHKSYLGEKNFRYLLGTGFGARYQYSYNASLRADWGYPLHKDIGNGVYQNNGRLDFSLIFSF